MRSRVLLFVTLFLLHLGINAFADDVIDKRVDEAKGQELVSFIAVSAVPTSAATALMEISEFSNALKEREDISEIHISLPSYTKAIDTLLQDPLNEYLEHLPLHELQKKAQEWTIHLDQLEEWNKRLRARVELFVTDQKILKEYSETWSQTYINASDELAPQPILDHISAVIIKIEELREQTKERYDLLLTDSNTIHTKILALKGMVQKTEEAVTHISSDVFTQNELTFTTLLKETSFSPLSYITTVYDSIANKLNELIIYYQNRPDRLWTFALFSIMIIIFVGSFNYLYRVERLFTYPESYHKKEYLYIKLPFSTSLLLILLLNVFIFDDAPESIKHFQMLFWTVPVFRIFQTLVTDKTRKYLYLYFILYLFSIIDENATGIEVDGRVFSLLLSVSLTVLMLFMIRDRVFDAMVKPFLLKYAYGLLAFSIVLLVIALGADLYGATLLADRITFGIFISLFTSMIFYSLTLILTGYTIILLRRRLSAPSYMLEQFAGNIEKLITLFIRVVMTIWWFLIVTRSIGAYAHLIALKDHVLAYSWSIGSSVISIQSIFDFLLIIVGTWFVVKLTQIILQLFLFSRFRFPRGIPTVISTVFNYVIVIGGSIIALSSLGISAEQFTLVIGALGVGIGFGLRDIIANFVSGIIMVFERPIQIGDTIEIDQTMGTVQAIGTRSSTIKTFDGSEVIIPNADFMAKEITNWTLSDERRRKTLLFRVDSSTEIRKVLAIMREVAMSHKDVLKEPEPMATFLGFGEYYLEFKLYFWLSDNIIMAPSDIAIDIYETLQRSGIKMPLPKQGFLKSD